MESAIDFTKWWMPQTPMQYVLEPFGLYNPLRDTFNKVHKYRNQNHPGQREYTSKRRYKHFGVHHHMLQRWMWSPLFNTEGEGHTAKANGEDIADGGGTRTEASQASQEHEKIQKTDSRGVLHLSIYPRLRESFLSRSQTYRRQRVPAELPHALATGAQPHHDI